MRSKRVLLILAAVTAATLLSNEAAYAWATSGRINFGNQTLANGQTVRKCTEAMIDTGGDNKAFTDAGALGNVDCYTTQNVPAGYIGAQAYGYRNGAYCGSTGAAYNNAAASSFGIGAFICSNPSGLQAFKTGSSSYFYVGGGTGYVGVGTQSPNQSY